MNYLPEGPHELPMPGPFPEGAVGAHLPRLELTAGSQAVDPEGEPGPGDQLAQAGHPDVPALPGGVLGMSAADIMRAARDAFDLSRELADRAETTFRQRGHEADAVYQRAIAAAEAQYEESRRAAVAERAAIVRESDAASEQYTMLRLAHTAAVQREAQQEQTAAQAGQQSAQPTLPSTAGPTVIEAVPFTAEPHETVRIRQSAVDSTLMHRPAGQSTDHVPGTQAALPAPVRPQDAETVLMQRIPGAAAPDIPDEPTSPGADRNALVLQIAQQQAARVAKQRGTPVPPIGPRSRMPASATETPARGTRPFFDPAGIVGRTLARIGLAGGRVQEPQITSVPDAAPLPVHTNTAAAPVAAEVTEAKAAETREELPTEPVFQTVTVEKPRSHEHMEETITEGQIVVHPWAQKLIRNLLIEGNRIGPDIHTKIHAYLDYLVHSTVNSQLVAPEGPRGMDDLTAHFISTMRAEILAEPNPERRSQLVDTMREEMARLRDITSGSFSTDEQALEKVAALLRKL